MVTVLSGLCTCVKIRDRKLTMAVSDKQYASNIPSEPECISLTGWNRAHI